MAKILRVVAGMLLLPACSLSASAPRGAVEPEPASPPAVAAAPPAVADAVADEPAADPRRVGDVVVHRFSGSFRRSPAVLTEEIVAKEGGLWVIDLSLEDGRRTTRLRVRMDPEGQVKQASRLVSGKEQPATIADYAALVQETVFSADVNDGLLASQRGTCLVGSRELECETKSYKVWMGERVATLKLSESAELPGQDVASEVTSEDGRLIYRSELLTVEHKDAESSVAER